MSFLNDMSFFKQRLTVVIRIFSTASREVLTFLSGLLSIRKSCAILCMSLDCSAVLNLSEESFPQVNCLGKRTNVSLIFVVAE